jgi:hypothetical protein
MLALIGAGLLAADLLRRLPAAWTGAPIVALLAVAAGALALIRARATRRRAETIAVLLPVATPPLCDRRLYRPHPRGILMRNRLTVFLLLVLALVLVPALLAHGLPA